MNLVEVLVAASLVAGSATGSLGIWGLTAHSSHDAGELLRQQLQADEQLLAVQARLQALAVQVREGTVVVPAAGCLQLGSQPLAQGDAGVGLSLSGDPAAQTLTATAQFGEDHSRTRVFDLTVYGLCAAAGGGT
ncbi:MAG: hypothetical protein AAFX65_06085 [Cyanobacteria bacterium J06638_7]